MPSDSYFLFKTQSEAQNPVRRCSDQTNLCDLILSSDGNSILGKRYTSKKYLETNTSVSSILYNIILFMLWFFSHTAKMHQIIIIITIFFFFIIIRFLKDIHACQRMNPDKICDPLLIKRHHEANL